jgi:hypothetical protein
MDRALDQFCVTTESGFEHGELDGADEYARAESYKSARGGQPFAHQQQRFLQAHFAIGWPAGNLFLENRGVFLQAVRSLIYGRETSKAG